MSVSMDKICPICLEDISFSENDVGSFQNHRVSILDLNAQRRNPVVTQCNHIFHASCLKQWIKKKANNDVPCPICRTLLAPLSEPSVTQPRESVTDYQGNTVFIDIEDEFSLHW